jgi:hypothetical protein
MMHRDFWNFMIDISSLGWVVDSKHSARIKSPRRSGSPGREGWIVMADIAAERDILRGVAQFTRGG